MRKSNLFRPAAAVLLVFALAFGLFAPASVHAALSPVFDLSAAFEGELFTSDGESAGYVFLASGYNYAILILTDEEFEDVAIYGGLTFPAAEEGMIEIYDLKSGETVVILLNENAIEIPDYELRGEMEEIDLKELLFLYFYLMGIGELIEELEEIFETAHFGELHWGAGFGEGFAFYAFQAVGAEKAVLILMNEDTRVAASYFGSFERDGYDYIVITDGETGETTRVFAGVHMDTGEFFFDLPWYGVLGDAEEDYAATLIAVYAFYVLGWDVEFTNGYAEDDDE